VNLYERTQAKNDARIQEATRDRLDPSETAEVSLVAMSRFNFLLCFAVLFPIALVLNLTGNDEWTPVALGGTIGLYFGLSARTFYMVLTSDRLLVARLKRFSVRRVEKDYTIDRGEDVDIELKQGMFSDFLTITSHAFAERLQVGRPHRERAAELVRRLSPGVVDGGSRTSP
jgi:hypothetical protein